MTIKEFQGEYRWLSNFWKAPMSIHSRTFFCNEQWYCYSKSLDADYREKIMTATTTSTIKRLGRSVKLRHDWDNIKELVMWIGLKAKFEQNEDLAQKLIDTGDELLQEGNRWGDKFWGVDLKTGEGKNMLGVLLMGLRRLITV